MTPGKARDATTHRRFNEARRFHRENLHFVLAATNKYSLQCPGEIAGETSETAPVHRRAARRFNEAPAMSPGKGALDRHAMYFHSPLQ